MMNYYYPYGMHYGFGGGFFSLLWFIFIVWLLVKIFRHFFGYHHSDTSLPGSIADTALDILKTRYAKGEITKKEFDQMKKDIS